MKSKEELRLEYKVKRCQLSLAIETTLNEMLLTQFMKIDLSKVGFLHIFIPIEKYHEPNTYDIINYIQTFFPQVKIVVSRSNFDDYSSLGPLKHEFELSMNEQAMFVGF